MTTTTVGPARTAWRRWMWMSVGVVASLVAVACGGTSGNGAAGNPTPAPSGTSVQLASSQNLGEFLVAANGRTLYFFGLDTAADASHAAVSNCLGACVGVWPVLDIGTSPNVGQGLTASDFGEFTRQDGAKQTTFKGWPLYFFSGDSKAGDTNGDNFEVWYVLRDPFYSVVVRTKSAGPSLFLGDPQGRTLYVDRNDTAGSSTATPVSACTDANGCLATWPIFLATGDVVPTGVDPAKLTTFSRPDGKMQSAFDGHPLYYFTGDTAPGDTLGDGLQDFTAVDPSVL
jgi:predicted lipoprotein with Yx(FWY)xxD motif